MSAGNAEAVSTSMPQGDPLSPLGLIVTLAEAVQSVSHAGYTQSVFLDDRLLVAATVKQLLQGWRLWKSWSRRLGLVENDDKLLWPRIASNDMLFKKLALLKKVSDLKSVCWVLTSLVAKVVK